MVTANWRDLFRKTPSGWFASHRIETRGHSMRKRRGKSVGQRQALSRITRSSSFSKNG
jgi:hypothetical protein